MLAEERAENERCIRSSRSCSVIRFGRRAESLPVDQLLLASRRLSRWRPKGFAGKEAADPVKHIERARKRRANRGALPAHLPGSSRSSTSRRKPARAAGGELHM